MARLCHPRPQRRSSVLREFLDEILDFVEPTLILDAATRTLGVTPPASAVADGTQRAALDPFGSSPEPAEVEMDSSPSGLQLLQKQLGDGDKNVNKAENEASGAQSAAADAQLRLKRARDAQAALQKTVDQAKTSTAAIDKAIAGSIGPSATASQIRTDMETALGKALSEDQRKAVDQVQKRSADQRTALGDDAGSEGQGRPRCPAEGRLCDLEERRRCRKLRDRAGRLQGPRGNDPGADRTPDHAIHRRHGGTHWEAPRRRLPPEPTAEPGVAGSPAPRSARVRRISRTG